jgi:phosphoribosylamine---glycine ligase
MKCMNILLLGSGGREHALAWKIAQSSRCNQLYIAPGNAGTDECGTNVNISPLNFDEVGQFVLSHKINMVVVGPEDPLVNGINDHFKETPDLKNIPVIGPSKDGAMLEGSKDFAKKFMLDNKIPTAGYQTFTLKEIDKAFKHIDNQPTPIVLKADGLAAGKGVIISEDRVAAKEEMQAMLQKNKFGAAGSKVVIEEFLSGMELSVFVLTDGKNYLILPNAKDYKRIGESDTGLNTGGMGAVSPVPFADDVFMKKVEKRIIIPTLKGLQKKRIGYMGFIFFGLINVNGDPYVIEYNCRLGDPETEVVIPRIQNDIIDLFEATAKGTLDKCRIKINDQVAATVVVVSGGYPEGYEKGKPIHGLEAVTGSLVFHSGTTDINEETVTAGGRVLAVTSLSASLEDALLLSYININHIKFEGMYYRKDIGRDLLLKEQV